MSIPITWDHQTVANKPVPALRSAGTRSHFKAVELGVGTRLLANTCVCAWGAPMSGAGAAFNLGVVGLPAESVLVVAVHGVDQRGELVQHIVHRTLPLLGQRQPCKRERWVGGGTTRRARRVDSENTALFSYEENRNDRQNIICTKGEIKTQRYSPTSYSLCTGGSTILRGVR